MKTTSILESIRNKINKIEKNTPESSNAGNAPEPHDDFEYIDDASKHIVDAKHSAGNSSAKSGGAEPEAVQATDEDFDFLSDGTEEENANLAAPKTMDNQMLQDPMKIADNALDKNLDIDLEKDAKEAAPIKVNPLNKNDDLDLENIDLEEETAPAPTPISAAPKNDDFDLENIDVDLEEEIKPPVISQKIDDLDLDLEEALREEGMDIEAPKVGAPKEIVSEQKNTTASENFNMNSGPEIATTNNYQDSMKTTNIQNKTSIISEDVARKTADTIKELINTVPKTQNHQIMSSSAPAFKSGETIEDMVTALLAPKLEQWINENLPPMVEKIVKNEIKKLLPRDDH